MKKPHCVALAALRRSIQAAKPGRRLFADDRRRVAGTGGRVKLLEKTYRRLIIRGMNDIEYTRKAIKQLSKLQPRDNAKIRAECRQLAFMPGCANVKALTNHEYGYRLRVGNYRVFFNFDGAVRIVSIEEVRKRDERTY